MARPNPFVAAWAAALEAADQPNTDAESGALTPDPAADYAEPAEWFY